MICICNILSVRPFSHIGLNLHGRLKSGGCKEIRGRGSELCKQSRCPTGHQRRRPRDPADFKAIVTRDMYMCIIRMRGAKIRQRRNPVMITYDLLAVEMSM